MFLDNECIKNIAVIFLLYAFIDHTKKRKTQQTVQLLLPHTACVNGYRLHDMTKIKPGKNLMKDK